jgi:signal transduction histidine kinase
VVVKVEDTGLGISKNDPNRIFDEFSRGKTKETRNLTGTGLGLPIARRIADACNGAIEVESSPQQGSVFRVLLPTDTV